ncbi:hypothetical protein ACEWY4_010809 [Coilia grayii]|uniref:Chemokine interleukin-8-like domain-containing protein n=1 Tax=Coilia grayii TaxID=363190 RepID=A0ABD1K2Z4_9TELE
MKTLLALVALVALVMIISVNAQYGITTTGCCKGTYPFTLPKDKVVSYIQASGRCPLKAHVFITAAKKKFCVNPDLEWVKNIVAISISANMKTLLALVALVALVMIISVNAQYGSTTTQCCNSTYPFKLPKDKVVSYLPASGRCPLKAHVFITAAKKKFCVNPDLEWVKNIVAKLNV